MGAGKHQTSIALKSDQYGGFLMVLRRLANFCKLLERLLDLSDLIFLKKNQFF